MTPAAMNDKDAAIYIGMSASWLRKSRCDGYLKGRTPAPPHIKIGSTVRYLVKDLDKWLEERRVIDGSL